MEELSNQVADDIIEAAPKSIQAAHQELESVSDDVDARAQKLADAQIELRAIKARLANVGFSAEIVEEEAAVAKNSGS